MATTKPIEAITPSEFIEVWGKCNIGDGMPSPDTLEEVARSLHAVQEFLVEPIGDALKKLVVDVEEADRGRVGKRPESEREVTYADIGRLIAWTDTLRHDLGFLHDPVAAITVLAHEELQNLAGGWSTDFETGTNDAKWSGYLRRFHGLERETVDAS